MFQNNAAALSMPLLAPALKRPNSIEPFQSFSFIYKNYEIKTVESVGELHQAYQLRHRVFQQEMCGEIEDGLDHDEFDEFADILIIKDTVGDRVVGTYRLISSGNSRDFYSESEFDLDQFLESDGPKLELSRACIDKDYRNGVIISLLWKGISGYAALAGAKYLFGCSSVWTGEVGVARGVESFLRDNGHYGDEYAVEPLAEFKITNYHDGPVAAEFDSRRNIPPLMRAYLKAGAKIFGEPAFDDKFNCMDFLTILEFDRLADGFKRKYQK